MESGTPNPMSSDRNNKKFIQVRAGKKFEKKKEQHLKKLGVEQRKDDSRSHSAKKKNIRVLQRQVNKAQLSARAEDLHSLPRLRVNKNYYFEPPKIVVVAGGKGSGKSTIIESLVRHYTRRKMRDIKGPITVKAGKSRVTFIECPSDDMNCLIDLSKVADIVLITIDTSFGFQMESFEFLNLLQVQGFPRIMGVMTKLDTFKHVEKMKTARRNVKKRFREEVSDTAKLFYFVGLRDGYFTPRDTTNLARFLSTKKPKPLTWRSAHPYVLADRVEDITHPSKIEENKNVKRHVSFYGWVRGTNFKSSGTNYVHIPGAGDFEIANITSIADPLPPNTKKVTKQNKEKQRGLYAPMTSTESLTFTQDAIYVEVDEHDNLMKEVSKAQRKSRRVDIDKEEWEAEKLEQIELLKDLQEKRVKLDEASQIKNLTLLRNGVGVQLKETENSSSTKLNKQPIEDSMEDNSDYDEEMGIHHSDWKNNMKEKAKARFLEKSITLHTLVYESEDLLEDFETLADSKTNSNNSNENDNLSNEIDSLFSKLNNLKSSGVNRLQFKNSKSIYPEAKEQLEVKDLLHNWEDQETVETIRNMFVTGDWNKRKGNENNSESEDENDNDETNQDASDDDSEMKDIDNANENESDEEFVTRKKKDISYTGESDSDEDDEILKSMNALKDDDISVSGDDEIESEEDIEAQRIKKKEQFDAMYDKGDEKMEEEPEFKSVHEFIEYEKSQRENPQDKVNRTAFKDVAPEIREKVEGIAPGTYVRIEIIDMPAQFVNLLKPEEPIIIGGLKPEEMQMGLLKMRIKRHRWFPKTLKTKDPIIFSIGWRRFQSIPFYCVQDPNGRLRYIKYTLDHMHCLAVAYAPFVPQNTGVVAIQNLSSGQQNFRISATGYTMEADQKIEIVKKLKLIGYPRDIKKNTCIIGQMFNSDLEVAKFQGAKLRTVSGIRGRVRKAVREGSPGDFRATFEDRVLESDIVFLRTWYPIQEIRFYNPIMNRLTDHWIRMRTVGELRHLKGLKVPQKDDSEYKSIKERNNTGHEVDLKPKAKIASALPFSHQKKEEIEITGVTTDLTQLVQNDNREKVKDLLNALKSDEERQRENLISRLEAIDADRRIKKRKQDVKRELKRLKEVTREERELRKRKRISEKERYIKQQLNRAKRAKYSTDS